MSDLHFMGRNNRVRISHFRQCSVSGPVAGAYRAARFHRLRCEGGEALLRGVRDHSQPDPPDPIVPLVLDRDRHKGLAERPATSLSGFLAAHVVFHPSRRLPEAGRDQVEPSPVAFCEATPMPFDNCPTPASSGYLANGDWQDSCGMPPPSRSSARDQRDCGGNRPSS